MFATQATVHSIASARILIVISAIAIVTFWRTIIKVVLIALAALMLVLFGFGAFALFVSMHG